MDVFVASALIAPRPVKIAAPMVILDVSATVCAARPNSSLLMVEVTSPLISLVNVRFCPDIAAVSARVIVATRVTSSVEASASNPIVAPELVPYTALVAVYAADVSVIDTSVVFVAEITTSAAPATNEPATVTVARSRSSMSEIKASVLLANRSIVPLVPADRTMVLASMIEPAATSMVASPPLTNVSDAPVKVAVLLDTDVACKLTAPDA